ncbi:putative porin [Pseudomonas aeruginosa]|nr:putative porin [Pseudomonas aeruginosa]
MQGDGKKRLWTLPLLLGAGLMASAVAEENAERSKEGFIEGSEVNLLLRNFYFNRDFRKGQSSPAGGGYTEEWVQGFMANFSSGFTQGTLGVRHRRLRPARRAPGQRRRAFRRRR